MAAASWGVKGRSITDPLQFPERYLCLLNCHFYYQPFSISVFHHLCLSSNSFMTGSSFTKYEKSISLFPSAHWPEKTEEEISGGASDQREREILGYFLCGQRGKSVERGNENIKRWKLSGGPTCLIQYFPNLSSQFFKGNGLSKYLDLGVLIKMSPHNLLTISR